jgi:hypothetical protein
MSQDLIYSFEIMGKGMLSIFTVIILLYIIVVLLSKLTFGKKNQENEE